jgi:CHAT domain-containing protein
VVADGLLHHLPFEALVLPGDGSPRYLAETHEIAYAHSAAVLAELSGAPAPGRADGRLDLLAVGDPDFGGREWLEAGGVRRPLPPLPHSGREARRIAGRLARARAFTGSKAGKALLFDPGLAGARVIHLATHALVNEASTSDSAIVFSLAGDDVQDGLLGLEEIGSLDLDADLVVLSACSTGLGRPVRGEGVVGLSRAFITAGSRGVVHTLWPVEDRFTADLMERFFDGLGRGESPASALAAARRLSLADGAHPHYWAPFVLVGDGASPLDLEPRPWWQAWWVWPGVALAIILVAIVARRLRR